MKFARSNYAIITLGLLLFAGTARAIGVGQVDDFEDGTLQNWGNGGGFGVPPVLNIITGGPAGANDNFMQVTADGSGAGRFLTVFNRSQWLGDYIVTGVTAIEMDLRNLGSVNLTIRMAFKSSAGPGVPGYLSAPFPLPVGSGWQHAVFLINPGTMIPIGGPVDFNSFFSNGVNEVRIVNEVGASNLSGDVVIGQLGVDNVHAIPEPSAALLTIAGLLAFYYLYVASRSSRQILCYRLEDGVPDPRPFIDNLQDEPHFIEPVTRR